MIEPQNVTTHLTTPTDLLVETYPYRWR